jgi:hypothetical protein
MIRKTKWGVFPPLMTVKKNSWTYSSSCWPDVMARGGDKGGGQGPRPEFSINLFKIQINFENLTLLICPNIQKINFLAPPLVMAPMLRLEIMNSSIIVQCIFNST